MIRLVLFISLFNIFNFIILKYIPIESTGTLVNVEPISTPLYLLASAIVLYMYHISTFFLSKRDNITLAVGLLMLTCIIYVSQGTPLLVISSWFNPDSLKYLTKESLSTQFILIAAYSLHSIAFNLSTKIINKDTAKNLGVVIFVAALTEYVNPPAQCVMGLSVRDALTYLLQIPLICFAVLLSMSIIELIKLKNRE